MQTNNQNIYSTFGEALSKALLDKEKNPAWLAKKIKRSRGQVSEWISDEHEPRPITIKKLSNVLSIEIKKTPTGQWELIYPNQDRASQIEKASQDVDRAKEIVAAYKKEGLSLDDLPELVRLKNELEKKIDELLRLR